MHLGEAYCILDLTTTPLVPVLHTQRQNPYSSEEKPSVYSCSEQPHTKCSPFWVKGLCSLSSPKMAQGTQEGSMLFTLSRCSQYCQCLPVFGFLGHVVSSSLLFWPQ